MKRHIAIIVALLIISALLFQSCRVHCSAFPEWLCKYAPYEKGSTVSFKNENDSIIELQVIEFYKSEAHSLSRYCRCGCGVHMLAVLISEQMLIEINFYLDAKESKQDVGAINNINVSIRSFDNDIAVVGQSYKDDFQGINPYDYGHEQKLGDTIVLQNKKYDDFSDMVIVKGKGLTEFYDKENNCTWRLVE
jgi:hypothetical protein